MGIDWILIRPARKKFLRLPKSSEWCNELWKIWGILQSLESGEPFFFINDNSEDFEEILKSPEWSPFDFPDEEDDPEAILYLAEDVVAGGRVALYHALRMMEKKKEAIEKRYKNERGIN